MQSPSPEYLRKRELYNYGRWACPVPPVCTAYWDEQAWINWIDSKGKWL